MKNILITGVGGQGSVLAAKILAQAAQAKGWSVREAETIGMAQRGGFVTSHVRMGDAGEEVYSPLLAKRSADVVIAFERAEAARALPYLAPDGLLVTASSAIQPVTATLAKDPYVPADVIAAVRSKVPDAIVVDDAALCDRIGNRKSQTLTLNLDSDFRGAIFAPNSRVCITGNNHTMKGFIIAKEFAYLDENGEEVVISAPQDTSNYAKLGLKDPTFDDFGTDTKLVNLNQLPAKNRVLFFNEQAKSIK